MRGKEKNFLKFDKWYHSGTMRRMPRKIRQLIANLKRAGFVDRGGKRSG